MAGNPACNRFVVLLSPFVDGELSAEERGLVEDHVRGCPECTGRVADLRAESGLVRLGLELMADEADFSDFSVKVLARLTPEKPPLFERWALSLSELLTYRRGTLVTVAVAAAVVLLVAVPLLLARRAPAGYASERMALQDVVTDQSAHVAPVVMNTREGDAIIWLVSHEEPEGGEGEKQEKLEELEMAPEMRDDADLNRDRPKGGEL